jgi:cytochrome c oxidase subunit II
MSTHRVLAIAALVTCLGHAASARQQPQQQDQQPRKVVHVTVERFAFMPSEIVVDEGTLLEIQLRSDDTNHGFRIKGTKTNAIVPKRGRGAISVLFDALTPGRYEFECSKMCGAGHSMMKGAIVVKARAERPSSADAAKEKENAKAKDPR